ncbi:DUF3349 domain-containing protein [Mycolicibacterium sp. CBMA 234]|uniref:DUF3349 domain-containing protein n=1 Tax=Mycolicibacterium sp. CBMA 234 TaxID=1918495 RepID=UPI001391D2A4|nr:DUF3349 domain-containing protein [Mycolicibacterium sp. CBMA 234]
MKLPYAEAAAAFVGFLRRGQPPIAPPNGYNPLLALMPRRPRHLADIEIESMAAQFARQTAAVSDTDIAVAIMTITNDLPTRVDIGRVRRSLLRAE